MLTESLRSTCSDFGIALERQPNIENLDVDTEEAEKEGCLVYFKRKDANCPRAEQDAFSAVRLYKWYDIDANQNVMPPSVENMDTVAYGEFAAPPEVSDRKISELKKLGCGTLIHDHTKYGECDVHHIHVNCTVNSASEVRKLAEILGK